MNKEFPQETTLNEMLAFMERVGCIEFTKIYDKEGIVFFNTDP